MFQTFNLQKAIKFATKTHEVYQKQKRKGKDIAYITHPLTVGLILSQAQAKEEVVIAGILHDTIEDSTEEKRVSYEMIQERFGREVADLVLSVTEQNKGDSWEKRKEEAVEHIKSFSEDSLLLKSADVIANLTELTNDYDKGGDKIFESFNAPKEKSLFHHLRVIQTILSYWPYNPLANDLHYLAYHLTKMNDFKSVGDDTAEIIDYDDYDEEDILSCLLCGWQGNCEDALKNSYDDDYIELACPICYTVLLKTEQDNSDYHDNTSEEGQLETELEDTDQEGVIVSLNRKKKEDIIKRFNKLRKKEEKAQNTQITNEEFYLYGDNDIPVVEIQTDDDERALGLYAWQNGEFNLKMQYLPRLITNAIRISREEFFEKTDKEKYEEFLKKEYK